MSGLGTNASPWVITFLNLEAGDLAPITVNSANLTGASVTVQSKHDGAVPVQEVQELWTNATQGYFAVTDPDGNVSNAVPFNARATDINKDDQYTITLTSTSGTKSFVYAAKAGEALADVADALVADIDADADYTATLPDSPFKLGSEGQGRSAARRWLRRMVLRQL